MVWPVVGIRAPENGPAPMSIQPALTGLRRLFMKLGEGCGEYQELKGIVGLDMI